MAIDWGGLFSGGISGLTTGGVGGAVLGAVSGAVGGGTKGAAGSILGGQIQERHAGHIKVKTTSGKTVWIKTAHRRRYSRRRGGGGMNSMLKQAMQFKMLSQAMK